jgi:precorrin-6B C5,15-methyltransferase / cobalt-precorrin-6B C5,C15-methyltransferase
MTSELLVVVGIGHDGPGGLAPEALEHIARARVLAGGQRHLAFFPDWQGEKLLIKTDLPGVLQKLKGCYRQQKTVVLASGDPLFYGIGHLLLQMFPKDDVLFLPHVSSVQLAFARIKESWHDACVVSLHGRPLQTLLSPLRHSAAKIAVLTDATNHPAAMARLLMDHGYTHYTLWVCEDLDGPGERVTQWTPQSIQQQTFSPLNVTVLLRCPREAHPSPALPLLGIPEEAIAHRQGMITKREMRLLALCYLELHPGDVLWDVGAGSGSVSLEAARLSAALDIFAIERDRQAWQQVETNVHAFALSNVHPVLGEAPEAFSTLPDPHAIFVGGSGGRLAELLPAAVARLQPGGRLVMHCITLENFTLGWSLLQEQDLHVDTTTVQFSHAKPLGTLHRLESESPMFILRARKA